MKRLGIHLRVSLNPTWLSVLFDTYRIRITFWVKYGEGFILYYSEVAPSPEP